MPRPLQIVTLTNMQLLELLCGVTSQQVIFQNLAHILTEYDVLSVRNAQLFRLADSLHNRITSRIDGLRCAEDDVCRRLAAAKIRAIFNVIQSSKELATPLLIWKGGTYISEVL